jgi:hypothetical protein
MLRKDSQRSVVPNGWASMKSSSLCPGFYELPTCVCSVAIAKVASEEGHEAMAYWSYAELNHRRFCDSPRFPRSPRLLVISRHCPVADHCAVERHTGRRSLSSVRAIGGTARSSRRCGSPHFAVLNGCGRAGDVARSWHDWRHSGPGSRRGCWAIANSLASRSGEKLADHRWARA